MPDLYQNLSDWTLPPPIGGDAKNALAGYGNNSVQDPRGGFSGINVVSMSHTASTVRLLLTEPIFMSSFLFGHGEASGLCNVQNMQFVFALSNLNNVIWSHAASGNTISSISTNILSASLMLNFVTPDPAQYVIPYSISYPYYEVIQYPTIQSIATPAQASATAVMSSVTLRSIPRRMFVYLRQQTSDWSSTSDISQDVFARITNIRVTWANEDYLASASEYQLYQMSVKNGLNLSFNQWQDFVGSPLCVSFGDDLPCGSLEAPGKGGSFQLGLQVQYQNPNLSNAVHYDLKVVVVSEGTATCIGGSVYMQVGLLTDAEILAARFAPRMPAHHNHEHVFGGNAWDSIKSFFSQVGKGIVKYGPSVLKTAATLAPLLGAGEDEMMAGDMLAGDMIGAGVEGGRRRRRRKGRGGILEGDGRRRRRHRRGRGLSGGELVSANELSQALGGNESGSDE
jgi:hypothetical protein